MPPLLQHPEERVSASGGQFEVTHHSEYLAKLVDEGRLKPHGGTTEICFHDPAIWAGRTASMKRPGSVAGALAQGAAGNAAEPQGRLLLWGGGGMSFMEEPPNKRVNQARARRSAGPGRHRGRCVPVPQRMMEDAINARKGDGDVCVRDVSEFCGSRCARPLQK